jgi:hypothetical protein
MLFLPPVSPGKDLPDREFETSHAHYLTCTGHRLPSPYGGSDA